MKTKKQRFSLALALLVLFSLALTACGSRKASSAADMSFTSEMSLPQEAPESEMQDKAVSQPSLSLGSENSTAFAPEKIIYSGSAELETMDFDAALTGLEALLADSGGFVQSSSINGTDFYTQHGGGRSLRTAEFVLRIPAERFSSFQESLKTLGNLPYSSTNAENISMLYSDTESRLNAAKIKEERLLSLLSQATNMEDILAIENSLSNVRYEIESLDSQLKNWDSQVSYSTLLVNIREVTLYTEDSTDTLSYGQQLREAFTRSLKAMGRFFKDLLKFFVAASPTLVLLGVIAVAVVFIVKDTKKKLSKKAAAIRNSNEDRPK